MIARQVPARLPSTDEGRPLASSSLAAKLSGGVNGVILGVAGKVNKRTILAGKLAGKVNKRTILAGKVNKRTPQNMNKRTILAGKVNKRTPQSCRQHEQVHLSIG